MSMMGSSKYEFEPDNFNKDYENKMKVATQFKEDLKSMLNKDYIYRDESKMSKNWKREILVDVARDFIEEL